MSAAKIGGSREVLEQGRGGMPQMVSRPGCVRLPDPYLLLLLLLRNREIS
jgi:hypothetical protein